MGKRKIIASLGLACCLMGGISQSGLVEPSVVFAEDKTLAKFKVLPYEKKTPGTWVQWNAPYAKESYPMGGTWGYSSCGVHSTAMLFAKVGVFWGGPTEHHTQNTYFEYMVPNKVANPGFAYVWENITSENTDGKLQHVAGLQTSSLSAMKEFCKKEYEKGNFLIVSGVFTEQKSASHIAFVDYVTKEGDVILCDCGWNYKYIESIKGPMYVHAFSSPEIKSYNAPKFTDGNAVEGSVIGGSSSGSSTGNASGGYDDESWETPVVQFNEQKVKNSNSVGIKGNKKSFISWLFG